MKPLFALFWQICRFRRGPEDVPYAPALAGLLMVAVAILLALGGLLLQGLAPDQPDADPQPTLFQSLLVQWLALAVWMGIVHGLLRFKKLGERFVQTLIAALGTDLIMALPQMTGFALLASQPKESVLAAVGQFSILFAYVWDMLIKGHIYARALNISRLQGNLLSLALSYGLFFVGAVLTSPSN